jgi:hypothetical protein
MANYAGSSMFKVTPNQKLAVHGMAGCRQLFPCGTLDERRNQVAILNFCKRKGQLHRIIRVGKRGCGTVHMLLASLTQLRMLI